MVFMFCEINLLRRYILGYNLSPSVETNLYILRQIYIYIYIYVSFKKIRCLLLCQIFQNLPVTTSTAPPTAMLLQDSYLRFMTNMAKRSVNQRIYNTYN